MNVGQMLLYATGQTYSQSLIWTHIAAQIEPLWDQHGHAGWGAMFTYFLAHSTCVLITVSSETVYNVIMTSRNNGQTKKNKQLI